MAEAVIKLAGSRGFEGTSMRAIAKATGLSVGALYRYIGCKEDLRHLFAEIADSSHSELQTKLHEHTKGLRPTDALKESISIYIRSVEEWQNLDDYRNYSILCASQELRKSFFDKGHYVIDYFNRLLTEGVNKGEFEVEDTYLMAFNISTTGNAWVNRRQFLRNRYSLEDYIRKETDLLLRSILPKRVQAAET